MFFISIYFTFWFRVRFIFFIFYLFIFSLFFFFLIYINSSLIYFNENLLKKNYFGKRINSKIDFKSLDFSIEVIILIVKKCPFKFRLVQSPTFSLEQLNYKYLKSQSYAIFTLKNIIHVKN
jgi:hypothetical protein